MNMVFWKQLATLAEEVFFKPSVLYRWDDIVTGVKVCPIDRPSRKVEAVSNNTWRSHGRKDNTRKGSSEDYKIFFKTNKAKIINELNKIHDRNGVHTLGNALSSEIKNKLNNTEDHILNSYNSIRKPVDLYLMNLVSMAEEVNAVTRCRLVPILFLPLDSQILGTFPIPGEIYALFTKQELAERNLKNGSSYGHVTSERIYLDLQDIIFRRASDIASVGGFRFHPIFFDLLWNQRYARTGRNLFETNP